MKISILFIMLFPVLASAKPNCKQQVTYLKNSLLILQETIADCEKKPQPQCNAFIGANHESILHGIEYAIDICPRSWKKRLNKIKRKIKHE